MSLRSFGFRRRSARPTRHSLVVREKSHRISNFAHSNFEMTYRSETSTSCSTYVPKILDRLMVDLEIVASYPNYRASEIRCKWDLPWDTQLGRHEIIHSCRLLPYVEYIQKRSKRHARGFLTPAICTGLATVRSTERWRPLCTQLNTQTINDNERFVSW